nr:hypothetical protein [Halopiger aswanensis]
MASHRREDKRFIVEILETFDHTTDEQREVRDSPAPDTDSNLTALGDVLEGKILYCITSTLRNLFGWDRICIPHLFDDSKLRKLGLTARFEYCLLWDG